MKKLKKDRVLYRKELYSECFQHRDSFGEFKTYSYKIALYKCYTLNGIIYQIQMPNCTINDKNIGRLMCASIEYAANEFPQNFRLKDYLIKKGIWKTL